MHAGYLLVAMAYCVSSNVNGLSYVVTASSVAEIQYDVWCEQMSAHDQAYTKQYLIGCTS